MKIKKFWKWKNTDVIDEMSGEENSERMLILDGVIAEESWFGDEVTPRTFRDELNGGKGNITVWINSPGGDCVAAAQIYNMLTEYNGKVTVKIDGMAASAASVIAMAGDTVLMSPVSTMMIHNPSTFAWGDHNDMKKAADMLNEFKEAIINSYEIKTGLSRAKLSRLMEDETYMNANKAVELGFADGIIEKKGAENYLVTNMSAVLFSRKAANDAFFNKLTDEFGKSENMEECSGKNINIKGNKHFVKDITERLKYIEKFI